MENTDEYNGYEESEDNDFVDLIAGSILNG